MPKEEKKYPPGYHRNDYFVEVELGYTSYALVKRELNREFNKVIFELHEIKVEYIDGKYYNVIGDPVKVTIKTNELIQWFGIAHAVDGDDDIPF